MDSDYNWSERTAADLLRFGLGFLGFILAAAGVVLTSPSLAIGGALLLLLIISSYAGANGHRNRF